MKKNVGKIDRIIRLVVLAVVAILYFKGIITGTVGMVLLAVGVVLGLTASISFCPLYTIFGINSSKKE